MTSPSMTSPTAEQMVELQKKATKGPWWRTDPPWGRSDMVHAGPSDDPHMARAFICQDVPFEEQDWGETEDRTAENMEFIAAARSFDFTTATANERRVRELEEERKTWLKGNAACVEVLNGLEWTGDGYVWNPQHGDYLERVIDALNRGKRAHLATLQAHARENERLREALKFYGDPNNWEDHGYENGLHWVSDVPAIDNGEKARAALSQTEDKT